LTPRTATSSKVPRTAGKTIDAGVAVEFRGGWGEFQADWVTDTLDRHNGEAP
jgi:hypothetical protein